MKKVNTPQSARYQPTKLAGTPAWGNITNRANDHQNEPKPQKATNPKLLPRGSSHNPATNCAVPPKAKAMASTSGMVSGGYQPALIMLSSQVVSANPLSPSGAGLPSFMD